MRFQPSGARTCAFAISCIERAFESLGYPVTPAYEASYVPTALGLAKAGLSVAVIA